VVAGRQYERRLYERYCKDRQRSRTADHLCPWSAATCSRPHYMPSAAKFLFTKASSCGWNRSV